MRKKRKRVHLRPAPILWLLLIVNVAVGLKYSKATSIVRARADGVAPFDKERVEGILAKFQDIPCLRVDPRIVETEAMQLPEVDNAEFSRNIFGNALLNIHYRTPVAKLLHLAPPGERGSTEWRVRNEPGVGESASTEALSSDGVIYQANELPADLPSIEVPQNGPAIQASLAGNWQPSNLAKLALYARHAYPGSDVKIDVNERGVVCLNIGSGRVILGSCDDLDLKLKTLETRLQKNPQELDQVQELNLTTPSAPAVVPKNAGKHSQPVRNEDQ